MNSKVKGKMSTAQLNSILESEIMNFLFSKRKLMKLSHLIPNEISDRKADHTIIYLTDTRASS